MSVFLHTRYDAFNRRISRVLDANGAQTGGKSSESYVWDGDNVVLDFTDSDGPGGTAQPVLAKRYLWGPAVDQLLAQETAGDGGPEDILWPLSDNLGSTRSLVNSDGTITATYSYDTFGAVIVRAGNLDDTRFLWTGQEYDSRTERYYMNARWYDPATGRFMVEDLIGFDGGDENLYRYVGNGPTNGTDPSGLEEITQAHADKYVQDLINDAAAHVAGGSGHVEASLLDEFSPETRMRIAREKWTTDKFVKVWGGGAHSHQGMGLAPEWVKRVQLPAPEPAGDEEGSGEGAAGKGDSAARNRAIAGAVLQSGCETAASFIPGVGEAMDLAVILDPKAAWWEKGLSGLSLGANVLFGGVLPNAGSFLRGGKRIAKAARECDKVCSEANKLVKKGKKVQAAAGAAAGVPKKVPREAAAVGHAAAARGGGKARGAAGQGAGGRGGAKAAAAASDRGPIRNQHLAGKKRHITKVPFDKYGFPIFDSAHDVKLPKALQGATVTDTKQFQHATEELNKFLQKNPEMKEQFTKKQLAAIERGEEKIPGYTWHHHQDGKTLQLVDANTHAMTGHSGGRQASGGRP